MNITIPLWTLPLICVIAAIIDWALEQARKFNAGRQTNRTGRQAWPNGGGTTAQAGVESLRRGHVTVLARSGQKDES